MVIETVNSFERFAELESDWNRLLEEASTRSVFLTHEWIWSWWKSYGHKRRLSILLLREEEKIRAIAPLMKTGYGIFARLSLIGGHRSDCSDFIVPRNRTDHYRTLLEHLLSSLQGWDEAFFENVPEDSPLIKCCEERFAHRLLSRDVLEACPYMNLRGREKEIRKKLLERESIRRKVRKLQEQGRLVFRHYDQREQMEGALPRLLGFYLRRFDALHWEDRLPSELCFHAAIVNRMDSKGVVKFAVLELDGKPIAWHFGFAYNQVYHWVRPAFDPSYAEFSPGLVLLAHLFEYALSNGYKEFNFLRGSEPFKMRWADSTRRVMLIRFYRSRGKFILFQGAWHARKLLLRLTAML